MLQHLGFLLLLLATPLSALGQSLSGRVTDEQGEPLVGATVSNLEATAYATTGLNGGYELQGLDFPTRVVISFVGFQADTLEVRQPGRLNHSLKSQQLAEVVVEGESSSIDEMNPMHSELLTARELTKAPCCNLSESFETNASVDLSYSNAVTGAKEIRLLGMDGLYVQTNRENLPAFRGLASRTSFNMMPGPWLQSIDLGKGSGSALVGMESMTGLINVELRKPATMDRLFVNGYANSMGRSELNVVTKAELSDKVSTGIFIHGNVNPMDLDPNEDGFRDVPQGGQVNVFNRWHYLGERISSQLGVHLAQDERIGGQVGYGRSEDPTTSALWGYEQVSKSAEAFGKFGVLFPHKPYKGIGILYSATWRQLDVGAGTKTYTGEEQSLYASLIYQTIISDTRHQIKVGPSFLVDDYQEAYQDSAFARLEVVPGLFGEYLYTPHPKVDVLLGLRYDYNTLYDGFAAPRLHLKYELGEGALRASAGRARRTPNPFADNLGLLASSRDIWVLEAPRPEESWNYGLTFTQEVATLGMKTQLTADYFYTDFQHKWVVDQDANASQVLMFNTQDQAFAHSFQLEAKTEVTEELTLKAAYKRYDIRQRTADQVQRVPFVPQDRVFINASYATAYDKWTVDLTAQWHGAQRLPSPATKPEAFAWDPEAPSFWLVNAQVARGFRWGQIYMGLENVFNFRQESPIVAANDPFGAEFDATVVWAPIVGRMANIGFRLYVE